MRLNFKYLAALVFSCLMFVIIGSYFGAQVIQAATPLPVAEEELRASESTPLMVGMQPSYEYFKAEVLQIKEEQRLVRDGTATYTQRLLVERLDNQEKIEVSVGTEFQPINETQRLKVGASIILTQQLYEDGTSEYVVADVDRWASIWWLVAGFFILVLLVSRMQGFLAIVGMGLSFVILVQFMIPQILSGGNPIIISLIGAGVIAVLTVYLSHGWSLHSHLALASMLFTLVAVSLLSWLAVRATHLAGLGTEEAYFLQFGNTAQINLQGLLLGGILLGALGILDDITIAQVSVVFELKDVNNKLSFRELYERGLKVGKDHVASLVNTLVLAYAGANLPLFLLFTLNRDIPLWVTLNNEIVAEEVVRTLVGSIGLVLAVPISTLLAAAVITRFHAQLKKNMHAGRHAHSHAH